MGELLGVVRKCNTATKNLVERLSSINTGDPYTYLSYKKVHNDLGLQLNGQTFGQSLRVQGLGELAISLVKENFIFKGTVNSGGR